MSFDDTASRLDHDQLFKRLIETFFEPTMRLLFPDAAARLCFDQVEFLPQEYFTDHPEGKKQIMDVVAQVGTTDEGPELILILGEVEYDRRTDFLAEMFDRFTLLRHRQKLPVFPIAVYLTTGAHGRTVEEYTESVLGLDVLRFRFACIALPDLNGVEYRQIENPVAPALAALMKHPGETRVEHKTQCLRELAQDSATEANLALLLHVVETYLPLSSPEQEEFEAMIKTAPFEAVTELANPFQKGAEQRMAREMLLRVLVRRFGSIPEKARKRIELADVAWCQETVEKAAVANSLADLGLAEA